MMNEATTCPRCGRDILSDRVALNALSRKDNETRVCPGCGTDEAMVHFQHGPDADVWPGFPGLLQVPGEEVSS